MPCLPPNHFLPFSCRSSNSTEANTSDEDEDGFGAGPATALHPTQFLAVVLGPSSFTFEQQFQVDTLPSFNWWLIASVKVVREIQALVLIATGKKVCVCFSIKPHHFICSAQPKLGRDLKAQICGSSNPPAVPDSSQTAEAIRGSSTLPIALLRLRIA